MTRLREAETLLRECQAHVYRQIHHGRHEQDRLDAADLHERLMAFLSPHGPNASHKQRG